MAASVKAANVIFVAALTSITLGTAKAEAAEAHLTGAPVGHHKFLTGVGEVTCEETGFEGTTQDGAGELTVTPTYKTCTTIDPFGTRRTTTVLTEGCDYLLTGGDATEGNPNHFEGIKASLKCPEGKTGIRIKVYNSTTHNSGHEDSNRRCEYVVHPFEHKLHNTAANAGSSLDDLLVTSNVTNIAVNRAFGDPLQCGGGSQSSNYTGVTTLKAYLDEAHTEQVTLTLTDSAEGSAHVDVGVP